jgi:hypothetical protein
MANLQISLQHNALDALCVGIIIRSKSSVFGNRKGAHDGRRRRCDTPIPPSGRRSWWWVRGQQRGRRKFRCREAEADLAVVEHLFPGLSPAELSHALQVATAAAERRAVRRH